MNKQTKLVLERSIFFTFVFVCFGLIIINEKQWLKSIDVFKDLGYNNANHKLYKDAKHAVFKDKPEEIYEDVLKHIEKSTLVVL